MERVSARRTDRMFSQLDAFALERGDPDAAGPPVVGGGASGRPPPPSETPSEKELLAILTERARAANLAAVRTLLVREEQKDPRGAGAGAV